MTMDEKQIKQIQQCEIDILKQVDRICKKYNLQYFAIGGTALGAVRHGGFIPWDDDIDIGMRRKDYEKFLTIAKNELPEGYYLQNFYTEPNTPFYFTKIRKDGTKFVEYYLKDYDIHHGIFVDIFPFDHIPNNPQIEKIHYWVSRILYQLFLSKSLSTVCSSRFEQQGNYKKNYKYYIRKWMHVLLIPVPKTLLFKALDKSSRMFNHQPTKRIGHIVRRRLAVSKKVLCPLKWMDFDSVQMPVPKDYDAYLTNQFGDYMKLPSEEQRYGHLPYMVAFDDGGEA